METVQFGTHTMYIVDPSLCSYSIYWCKRWPYSRCSISIAPARRTHTQAHTLWKISTFVGKSNCAISVRSVALLESNTQTLALFDSIGRYLKTAKYHFWISANIRPLVAVWMDLLVGVLWHEQSLCVSPSMSDGRCDWVLLSFIGRSIIDRKHCKREDCDGQISLQLQQTHMPTVTHAMPVCILLPTSAHVFLSLSFHAWPLIARGHWILIECFVAFKFCFLHDDVSWWRTMFVHTL